MRKINLKTLSSDEILTREELVKIIGGNGTIDPGCGESDIPCERDGTYCQTKNDNCICEWVQSEPQEEGEESENFLVCMDFR